MKKTNAIILGVAILLILAGASVTFQWRYDHVPSGDRTILVRTNRFTGKAETFDRRTGWTEAGGRLDPGLQAVVDDIIANRPSPPPAN